MDLDILAFGAHPDDVELSCSGILYTHKLKGKRVGVIDLTQGELGSRGTAETRAAETAKSTAVLELDVRENLNMRDGFFTNDEAHQLKIIQVLRKYRPKIVLMNAPHDRHPDHGRAACLVRDACFLSGLIKIETSDENGLPQPNWRPKRVFHYVQDTFIEPTFIVDISTAWTKKMESILCYSTQFNGLADENGPETYISGSDFLASVEARAKILGKRIGVAYGEGLIISEASLGLTNLFDIILPEIS